MSVIDKVLTELRTKNERLEALNSSLVAALKEAKLTIKILHGPTGWDIYDQRSPEMTKLNATIKAAEDRLKGGGK